MDLSKFSTEDLIALKAGDLTKMSDEGLAELKAQQSKPLSVAEQNLKDLDGKGPLDELAGAASAGIDAIKTAGKHVAAGYTGIADLIAGNGLDKSVENIGHVKKDEDVTSGAGVWGQAFGDQFTPVQIALQASGEKIASMAGPWIANTMKGWAADAAVNAIGKIKNIAKALGVTNLDAVGKFLLTPIKFGAKEFEPIVTATASPADMLAAAKTIQSAAGKELEAVSKSMDGAIKGAVDQSANAVNNAPVILDVAALTKNVQTLKEEAVGDLPNLGKAVAKQYDDALKDLAAFVKKQMEGDTKTMFSDLSAIKTKLGGLVYKHGSPLESKAALNDVYHAISNALDSAAEKVGSNGAAYAEANSVYHQVTSVVEALEGKVVDAKKWFDAPSFLAAMSAGFATHGPLAAVTVPTAYVGMKAAQKYGPQAIAAGLNAGAPLANSAIQVGARALPVVGRAIADALTLKQADE